VYIHINGFVRLAFCDCIYVRSFTVGKLSRNQNPTQQQIISRILFAPVTLLQENVLTINHRRDSLGITVALQMLIQFPAFAGMTKKGGNKKNDGDDKEVCIMFYGKHDKRVNE